MKNKVLVLGLAFSLLVCAGNLVAMERHGAEVVIQKIDGQIAKGELIAIKSASLVLLDSRTGVDVSADVNDIRDIVIVKKSKALQGAGIGFLAGAVPGALLGYIAWERSYEVENIFGSQEQETLVCAAILGGVGAIIGAVVGSHHGKDKTIQIEGKSDTEVKEILEKMRREARIPDAQ